MKKFSKSVLNFKGNSILQDIFQSGFIPADTDYKSFSNIGMIGIDTAFYENGQIYHTKVDDSESIDENSIQHMGQSSELFVKHMIQLDENYQNKDTLNSDDSKSSPFYFDFLSYKLFVFNFEEMKPVFISVFIIGSLVFIQQLISMGVGIFIKFSILNLISFGSCFAFANLFGFILTFILKNTMSWYTIGSKFGSLIYFFPCSIGVCLPFFLLNKSDLKFQHFYSTNLSFWLFMLSIGIYFQKGYSLICLLFIISISLLIIFKKSNFLFYIIFFIPLIYLFEFEYTSVEFIYAILGRSFMKFNEFAFGSIVAFYTYLFSIFMALLARDLGLLIIF